MNVSARIADLRISEAHAMVSLRFGRLYLLALRRKFRHNQIILSELCLELGQQIELAAGVTVEVVDVQLPARIFALRIGDYVTPLAQVASIFAGPPPHVVNRFEPAANAHVWSAGPDFWQVKVGDSAPNQLIVDQSIALGSATFILCLVDPASCAGSATEGQVASLRLVSRFDSFEIFADGRSVSILSGVGARLLSELASYPGPANWQWVSATLWPTGKNESELRRRWDVTLLRLRAKLKSDGVRSNLVRSDGNGLVQLVLHESDVIEDCT
jgi:hypothetical protein